MLPANLRELLSAAVDGELSAAERKTAQRLLRESPEARALFAQLKADAGRLKNLPRVAAPADLADNVMSAINERAMTPTPLPPSRKPAPRFNWSAASIWINLVTAACVLIVISVGSYLYFSASQRYFAEQSKNVASNTPAGNSEKVDHGASKPGGVGSVAKSGVRESGPPAEFVAVPRQEFSPEIGPSPRLVPEDRITGPITDDMPEIGPLQIDKIRVSHLFNPHELADDEAARNKLAAEMKKDELIRLDLFCRSTPGALDLVQSALKARGIVVFTDAFAQEQLKKKSPPELMIFTEALTPDEVAQLLTALGAEDKKGGAGEFDTLVAAPFLPADLTQMSKLLGIPAVAPKPAKGKTGVDIRKPLPEGTANQVADSLSKLGSGSRPPKNEKVAVVVSYSPINTNPAASKEIKQFLDRRGDRKPDAKPLMLVLKTIK
jgi:negative regulator of sigma E activity